MVCFKVLNDTVFYFLIFSAKPLSSVQNKFRIFNFSTNRFNEKISAIFFFFSITSVISLVLNVLQFANPQIVNLLIDFVSSKCKKTRIVLTKKLQYLILFLQHNLCHQSGSERVAVCQSPDRQPFDRLCQFQRPLLEGIPLHSSHSIGDLHVYSSQFTSILP